MEITGKNGSLPIETYANVQKTRERPAGEIAPEARAPANAAQDKVILSPRAREVYEAQRIADGTDDVRNEKVTELKAQIAGGTYRVDGNKIAVKMMRESILNEIF